MGSIIFVIIIIAVSIAASMKKQSQQKARSSGRNNSTEEYAVEHAGTFGRQSSKSTTRKSSSYNNGDYSYSTSGRTGGSAGSSMKSRANVSGSSTTGSYATEKAAERAKDNMSAQELKFRPSAQEFKQMAGVEASDGAILSAAKMHSLATELGNEFDSKEDLMEPVYNLMVTGPDTSIPNERDFVSEGMDMINSYNC